MIRRSLLSRFSRDCARKAQHVGKHKIFGNGTYIHKIHICTCNELPRITIDYQMSLRYGPAECGIQINQVSPMYKPCVIVPNTTFTQTMSPSHTMVAELSNFFSCKKHSHCTSAEATPKILSCIPRECTSPLMYGPARVHQMQCRIQESQNA